jgi:hypothetical protein
MTLEELRALAEPYIPRELIRTKGRAFESPNGFLWVSWGSDALRFHLTVGDWGLMRMKRRPRA